MPSLHRRCHFFCLNFGRDQHALPLTEDQQSLSEHFGEAPYFLLLITRAQDGSLLEEEVLTNPFRHQESGRGIKVGEWMVGLGVDEVIVPKALSTRGLIMSWPMPAAICTRPT